MSLKNYWNLLTGQTKYSNPAKLTFRNIKAVFQAWVRKGREMAGFNLPQHIYEQILYRRFLVIQKSPKCWESGNCVYCGCEILGKTMEDRACTEEPVCYPVMMEANTWKDYKKSNNIKLFD